MIRKHRPASHVTLEKFKVNKETSKKLHFESSLSGNFQDEKSSNLTHS